MAGHRIGTGRQTPRPDAKVLGQNQHGACVSRLIGLEIGFLNGPM